MSRQTVKVAVGILLNEGKVLCCQRKKDARYGLQWEFPGGKMHDNESPVECLKRELTEELDITVLHIEHYDTRVQEYSDNGIFEVHYFLIKDFNGDIKNNSFESIRWISPHDFDAVPFLEGNIPVLQRLKENYTRL